MRSAILGHKLFEYVATEFYSKSSTSCDNSMKNLQIKYLFFETLYLCKIQ